MHMGDDDDNTDNDDNNIVFTFGAKAYIHSNTVHSLTC